MSKKLIVNADDFGLGKGVTDAIIECHRAGLLTSTTLMVNMPAAEYAIEASRKCPDLGVGIHLVLTQGRPVSASDDVPALVDPDGNFWPHRLQRRKLWFGRDAFEQVVREFTAQIRWAIERGVCPTHCDSHHGIHRMPIAIKAACVAVRNELKDPKIRNQMGYSWAQPGAPLASRFLQLKENLPRTLRISGHVINRWVMRRYGIRCPDRKIVPNRLVGGPDDYCEAILASFASLPEGVSEIIFHPGHEDEQVKDKPGTAAIRRVDTKVLLDDRAMAAILENDVKLINYSQF